MKSAEVRNLLDAASPSLPKYVSPLLNLANRFAQGTRPKVVGQMSELIQQFEGRTIEQWAQWYQEMHPNSVADAVKLIRAKLGDFSVAMESITDEMIEMWVKDLVLTKTFVGLRFQEAILRKVSQSVGLTYRIASPEEESRGVDGLIGTFEVSIKPASWEDQVTQREALQGSLIIYRKTDDGLEIEFEASDFGKH